MTAPDVHALLRDVSEFVGDFLNGYDDDYAAINAMQQPKGRIAQALRIKAALAHAPATPADKTCATCQWWSENKNPQGVSLGDGRCFKGVRVGNPTRQSVDGGLYTHAAFGCLLHEPAPVASVRGEDAAGTSPEGGR